MLRKFTLIIICSLLVAFNLAAQQVGAGFTSITSLSPESTSTNTGEKPQSKPWSHDGKWWAVFPNSGGTYLWRLDGTQWTSVLKISSRTTSKADCKSVGDITHILLYQGASSQIASVEYDSSQGTYKLWSKRTSTVGLTLDKGVETATIDIDSRGRMWLASAGVSDINVRWSDAPYSNWSSPITIATGVDDDDICAVIALPGKIGVIWSNQNTKRFGFKTHTDGADPSAWSSDEVPASQSAQNVGNGMADDHLNMAVASDGTLFCAVKTEYNTNGYPQIALLIRRPTGSWDRLYNVSEKGTRPIVILNEIQDRLKVIYTASDSGGDILYRESAASNISFGPQLTLMKGSYNNPTSSKDNYSSDIVVLASSSSQVVGVLATDGSTTTEQYSLTVNTSAGGTVSKSPDHSTYSAGSTVSLSATPASGYQFAGWSGDASGSVNPLAVTMDRNKSITANFTALSSQQQVTSFTLINASNEQDLMTISDGQVINLADLPTSKLNIRANTDPATVGSVRFELSGPQSRAYTDNAAPYALHGDDGNGNYYYGIWNPPAAGTYTLKATPFSSSKANGTAGAPLLITFTVVESTTPAENYALTVASSGSGTVSKSPNQSTYAAGSTVSLTATPASGYQFAGWSGDASGSVNPLAVTMDRNKSITANFTAVSSQQQVTGFTLIAANTDTDIGPVVDGQVISLDELPSTKLTIRANTDPASVGSVLLELSGPQSRNYVDNAAPYSLFGDDGSSNYYFGSWNPPATGTYTLRATPYSEASAKGTAGIARTITFTFTSSGSTVQTVSSSQQVPLAEREMVAYPNPFYNMATISFTAPEEGQYTLKLFDARGVQISLLQQGRITGEKQEVEIDGTNLPKGLYFIQLQTEKKVRSLRLVLDK